MYDDNGSAAKGIYNAFRIMIPFYLVIFILIKIF